MDKKIGPRPGDTWAAMIRRGEIQIAHNLREYKRTNNPIYLIKARIAARESTLPVPEEVEDWLDGAFDKFISGTSSLDVATGLSKTTTGTTPPLNESINSSRDNALYNVMFSLFNLADHLKPDALTQKQCAQIAAIWLVERKKDIGRGWEDVSSKSLSSRFSKWKKKPPVTYPEPFRKEVLNEHSCHEWESIWKSTVGTGAMLNMLDCHIETIKASRKVSTQLREELLNILKDLREAVRQKSGYQSMGS